MMQCNLGHEFLNFIYCFYLSIRAIPTGDILMYIAIILAYMAYRHTKIESINSGISLFKSLLADIEFQKKWLQGDYSEGHKDKNFYSPRKIVYALSFESLKAIIQRGVYSSIFRKDNNLEKMLSEFNERVEAFNQMLNYQKDIICFNPTLSYKLYTELCEIGLKDNCISFSDFKHSLNGMQSSSPECFLLANKLKEINEIIHIQLISTLNRADENKFYCLSYLSKNVNDNISNKIDSFKYPFYLANKSWQLTILIFISLFSFYLIEIFFK